MPPLTGAVPGAENAPGLRGRPRDAGGGPERGFVRYRWLMLGAVLCGCASPPSQEHPAEARLAAIVQDVQSGAVDRVQVIHVPDHLRVMVSLTPSLLLRAPAMGLAQSTETALDPALRQSLEAALAGLAVRDRPPGPAPDRRWAVILHAGADGVPHSIFFSEPQGGARAGLLDDQPVTIGGTLAGWGEERLASVFDSPQELGSRPPAN